MNTRPNLYPIERDAKDWLAHLEQLGRSPRTISLYATVLQHLARHLRRHRSARTTREISADLLQEWQRTIQRSDWVDSSRELYVRVVQQWFAWLVGAERLFMSPAGILQRPKWHRPLGRFPSVKQVRELLESIAGTSAVVLRDRALLELAYSTGVRCEEIIRLDERSVNLDQHCVQIRGKGGRGRCAPLGRVAANALAAYLENGRAALLRGTAGETALFVGTRDGCRLTTHALASIVRRRGKKVGVRISPHDLRRAFATHLLARGAGLAHLKKLLGHKTFRHMKHYLQLAPTNLKQTHDASPVKQ